MTSQSSSSPNTPFLNISTSPIRHIIGTGLLALLCGNAVAESQVEWAERALSIQNSLDNDAPLAQSTWVGSHNSFANADDDNLMDFNQSSSLKEQMEQGVRELVFDLHYDSSAIRMCHNNVTSFGECIDGITGNRKFYKGLEDIRDWIKDGNDDQVILLKLELASDAKNNINKVEKKIDGKIYDYVYRTELTDTHGDYGKDGCTELESATLTKSKVLNAGKNIIIFNTENCIGDNGFNDMSFYGGDNIDVENSVSDFKGWSTEKKNTVFSRNKDGTTRDGQLGSSSANMHPSDVHDYMLAGLNIFELYGYGASGSSWKVNGEYPVGPEDMVWSWSESSYEPNSTGSCAQLSSSDDRFVDTSCNGEFYAACRKLVESDGSRAINSWAITTQKTTLANADTLCLQENSGDYFFATPRNAMELQELNSVRSEAALSSENIWLNYQLTSGKWVADIGEADSDMQVSCDAGIATTICDHIDEYLDLNN